MPFSQRAAGPDEDYEKPMQERFPRKSGSNIMSTNIDESSASPSRRNFVKGAAVAAIFAGIGSARASALNTQDQSGSAVPNKPKVIIYVADETRWDLSAPMY
jgi:hypothetical protein